MDDADKTDIRAAVFLEATIRAVQATARRILPGEEGDCEKCGEHMPRLINGVCCPCRDRLRLK
jgi:hypothetical protein